MQIYNKKLDTNVPLNANYTSPFAQVDQIYTYAVQAVITGTPTGTISLQASNDPTLSLLFNNVLTTLPPGKGPSNWTTIANSTFTVTTAGIEFWNVNYTGYNYIRVAYTDTSGGTSTATMTITFNGKG